MASGRDFKFFAENDDAGKSLWGFSFRSPLPSEAER